MTGVDILSVKDAAAEFAFNWTLFWIVVAVAGIGGLIYAAYCVVQDGGDWWCIPLLTVITMFIGAYIGWLLGWLFNTPTKYIPEYKVTISDEVKMTEFYEKYEIIDVEGKIYTVRERED